MRIHRIPLPTSLYFVAETDWQRSCAEHLNLQSSLEPAAKTVFDKVLEFAYRGPALVWYIDDPDEHPLRAVTPGGACLQINVRLPEGDLGSLNRWLDLAAADRFDLPTVDFDFFHFVPTREVTEKTGAPTWGDFLEGKMPALPRAYTINFRREQHGRPIAPTTLLGRTP